jgi:inorganic phosphate transporter, PiT family
VHLAAPLGGTYPAAGQHAVTVVLVLVATAFAFSLGAHYTGACMGMPYALGTVTASRALRLMAPLAWLGAAVASHAVEHTVAFGFTSQPLTIADEVVVVGVAFGLTTAFTQARIPTSTIQILVFAILGVALAEGVGVSWSTVGWLVAVWLAAPAVALALGYALTRTFDGIRRRGAGSVWPALRTGTALALALTAVGAGASFVMGSNDVANATGALVATRTFSPQIAGVVGGGALAAGVLTWGRALLTRVAFDIVRLDTSMATAAQAVQGLVVLTAVMFGFFTSMNQALVAAMVGAGRARGDTVIDKGAAKAIAVAWLVGPAVSIATAFCVIRLAMIAGA